MGVTLVVTGADFVSITLDGIVDGNDAATGCCICDCGVTPIPPELGLTEELDTATFGVRDGVRDEAAGGLLAFMLEAATEAAADRIAAAAMAAVVFAFVPA